MPATSDHPSLAQGRDVVPRVAKPGQHLFGVLPEGGRRQAQVGRRVGELDRVAERRPANAATVVHLDDHAAVADLRILHHLGQGRHRAEADVEIGEQVHPFGHRALAELRAEAREHPLALGPLGELLAGELAETEQIA